MTPSSIHLLIWSGEPDKASSIVANRYPDCEIELVNQREFREAGWRGQLRKLGQLRGRALVFFFDSYDRIQLPQLLAWSGLRHRCGETVLADSNGRWQPYRRSDWSRMLPKLLISGACDLCVLASTWLLLHLLIWRAVPVHNRCVYGKLAYLFPFPIGTAEWGGAMSHVRGVLGGLSRVGVDCEVYSSRPLTHQPFRTTVVPCRRVHFIFPESVTLGFNIEFVRRVYAALKKSAVSVLYQRHRRFIFSGALLSRFLGVPLVLEYNGSEVWSARHWDPARFGAWLRLCEDFSLSCASLIVVVSDVLRDELVSRGVPESKIVVNPNGVDPDIFRPHCGGQHLRSELGFCPEDVVVGFVGTFSYWHGVEVLRQTILRVCKESNASPSNRLKFLLIGRGPLLRELQDAVSQDPEAAERVVFIGPVDHQDVPAYLDAADILVSPHVPMPDGRRFFGSPTKLFEYMAMGKAIVASNLDQLAKILEHSKTALLTTPGNPNEVVDALYAMADNPELRRNLGAGARATVVAHYTWAENAKRVLRRLGREESLEKKQLAVSPAEISSRRGGSDL